MRHGSISQHLRHILLSLGLIGVVSAASAAPTVLNPSFEVDDTPGFPGMKSDITNWTCVGGTGINDIGGPFHSGLIPDGEKVALIQHDGSLTQAVDGFEAGKQYYLYVFENGRDGNLPHGKVSVGGTDVIAEHEVAPVGGGNPYHFKQATFDSPGAGAFDVSLAQVGDAGDNTILYDMVSIVEVGSAPNLFPSSTSIDFGNVTQGSTLEKTLTIYNNGGKTLTVNSTALSGTLSSMLTVVSPTGSFTVAPGATKDVVVGFTPDKSGTLSNEVLTINSDDSDAAVTTIPLNGVAVGEASVTNGSFEVDAQPAWPGYTTSATGWVFSGANCGFADWDNNAFWDNGLIPDGSRVGLMQGGGWVKQSVPGFVAGKTYKISMWINSRASTANPLFICTLGSTELFRETIVPVDAEGERTVPFHHYEATYTATATGNLDLTITSGPVDGEPDRALTFDNITVGLPQANDQTWNPYQAIKATTAPVVDGVISANEYPGYIINMTKSNMSLYGGTMNSALSSLAGVSDDKDLSGKFIMMWDETYLYLAAKVTDDEINYLLDQGGALNASDGIQLCLDYNNTGKGANEDDSVTIHDVVVGQKSDNNTAAYWQHWSKTQGNEAGYPKTFPNSQFKSRKVTGGYEIEFAIKWSDCTGFSGATVGKTMGYMTLIMEFEGGANTDLWVNGGNGANVIGSASGWNKMVLVDAAQGPVNAARRGWTLYQ